MNHAIAYRPYRSHAWFVPFAYGIGIISIFAAGYSLPHIGFATFVLLGIGIVCFLLAKVLYDSSSILVLLEQEGLRITGGNHSNYRYIPWKELSYAYYTRSYRGHLFLILSPTPLSQKQTQILTNRGANTSKICVDSVVVIHIDTMQNTSQLKETVVSKVLHIDSY